MSKAVANSSERLRAVKRRWWKRNKLRMKTEIRTKLINRYNGLRFRCKREGRKFLVSYKSYCKKIKDGCFYCGVSLLKETGANVDRMNNNIRDYTSRNLVGCCSVCNKVKSNMLSAKEMKVAMTAVMKLRKNQKK